MVESTTVTLFPEEISSEWHWVSVLVLERGGGIAGIRFPMIGGRARNFDGVFDCVAIPPPLSKLEIILTGEMGREFRVFTSSCWFKIGIPPSIVRLYEILVSAIVGLCA